MNLRIIFFGYPFDLANYIIDFTSAQFCEPLFTERHQVAQKAKCLPTLATLLCNILAVRTDIGLSYV